MFCSRAGGQATDILPRNGGPVPAYSENLYKYVACLLFVAIFRDKPCINQP